MNEPQDCPNCDGTGNISIPPGSDPCPKCGGTGYQPVEQSHPFDPWKVRAIWYGTDPPTILEHGNLIEIDHGIGQVMIEGDQPVVTDEMIERAWKELTELEAQGVSWRQSWPTMDVVKVVLRAALKNQNAG